MYIYINETRKYLSYIQTLLEWGGQMIRNPTHNSWFYERTKNFNFQFMNLWIDKNIFLSVYQKC